MQHVLYRRVTLVESLGDNAGVAIQRQRHLRHVIRSDGKSIEVFEELLGKHGVGRNLAHHDDAQAVVATFQTVGREQFQHLPGFGHGAHEGHHDFHVGEAHLVAHLFHGAAFEFERLSETIGYIARGAPESQHRVFLVRFVFAAAGETGILVGFEIRKPHDYRLGPERGAQCRHALYQLLDIKRHRVGIAGAVFFHGDFQIRRQIGISEHGLRMHADHARDDELQPRQAHAFIGQAPEFKRELRITHVHGDFHRRLGHGAQ